MTRIYNKNETPGCQLRNRGSLRRTFLGTYDVIRSVTYLTALRDTLTDSETQNRENFPLQRGRSD